MRASNRLSKPLLALAIMVLLSAGCTGRDRQPRLLQIGDSTLTLSDVVLRSKEQAFENNSRVDEQTAALQLIRAYAGAEILKKYGRPVSQDVLEKEGQRIEKSTLMPNRLKQLKELFPDRQAWLRVYVLPVYVSRELYYGTFARSPRFHEESLEKLGRLAAAYRSDRGKGFLELARAVGLRGRRLVVSASGIMNPDRPADTLPAAGAGQVPPHVLNAAFSKAGSADYAARLIEEVLSKLAPGGLTQPLDQESGFALMRLVSVEGGRYTVEVASVPKTSYGQWFSREFEQLGLECDEQQLCPSALRRAAAGVP